MIYYEVNWKFESSVSERLTGFRSKGIGAKVSATNACIESVYKYANVLIGKHVYHR